MKIYTVVFWFMKLFSLLWGADILRYTLSITSIRSFSEMLFICHTTWYNKPQEHSIVTTVKTSDILTL